MRGFACYILLRGVKLMFMLIYSNLTEWFLFTPKMESELEKIRISQNDC